MTAITANSVTANHEESEGDRSEPKLVTAFAKSLSA